MSQPGQTTYVSQPAVGAAHTATYEYQGVPQYALTNTSVAQKAVASEIPVESRIEYIPFEKKYVEY